MINKKIKNTAFIVLAVSVLVLMLSGCIEESQKENQTEKINQEISGEGAGVNTSEGAGVNTKTAEIKETTPFSGSGQQASQEVKINLQDNKSGVSAFKIDGMSCGGCVETIKNALSKVKGVNKYEVYFGRPGKAVVEYKSETVSPDEIASAITKSGYPAALISSNEASGIQETTSGGTCGGSTCGSKSSGGGCGCSR